jgi:hypothetical protein
MPGRFISCHGSGHGKGKNLSRGFPSRGFSCPVGELCREGTHWACLVFDAQFPFYTELIRTHDAVIRIKKSKAPSVSFQNLAKPPERSLRVIISTDSRRRFNPLNVMDFVKSGYENYCRRPSSTAWQATMLSFTGLGRGFSAWHRSPAA